ncbi:MAG: efflux RND transporter periplasmic adaptor subunit [Planctomycetaceae bacterium]
MATELDLRQLAIDRGAPPKAARRRKRVFARYLLPGMILLGFAGMLAWGARDWFLLAKPVTVVPVIVARAEVQQAGTPLFQAAGWIEPRPTPVLVPALAEGVVRELLVVEGQEVQAGEPVARLIDVDARLALQQAESDLALRKAELASAHAELQASRLRLKHPVHLEAALAEAESNLATTERELAGLPFLIRSAKARVEYARQNLEGKQSAGTAIAGRLIQQAQSDYDSALAENEELEQREPQLQRQVDALERRRNALAEQLRLLIEENRNVADGEARVQAAEARLKQARLAVDRMQLQLERMVVEAPISGRVLQLIARPGTRVMGLSSDSAQDATSVVSLYDPNMLQVRADVRLEEVPLVQPGQPVRIETASSKEPLSGRVLTATSAANIQKNTLEVKVAIETPSPTIRPDMLVTATFLAPDEPEKDPGGSEQRRLLVPRSLVRSSGEGSALWIADPEGFARLRSVRLGKAGTEELVEVVEGLAPTDKLISGGVENLADGDRITIAGEDAALGVTAASGIRETNVRLITRRPTWRSSKFAI